MQTKLADCTATQLSTIAAISTEKMLLLDGEPTTINKELTDVERASRAAAILEHGKLRLVGQPQ